MTKFSFLFSAAFLSLLIPMSCTKVQEEGLLDAPMGGAVSTKVVKFAEEYDSSSFLVKFESVPDDATLESFLTDGVTSIEKLFTSFPGKEELEAKFGLDRWYVVSVDEKNLAVENAVEEFAGLGIVQTVEFNSIATKDYAGVPYGVNAVQTKATGYQFNDPLLVDQWHYINGGAATYSRSVYAGADINVKDVWRELTCGDPSIIVAVVDEGVKYTHPDLAANMWTNDKEIPGNGIDDDHNGYVDDIHGYNFVDDGEISWAKSGDRGHGTHVSGTIAAVNNNGIGVSGVAGGSGNGDGCRIMSCQIFSGSGGGSPNQTANAIKYAADMGASIISCSFGYDSAFDSDDAYIRSQGSAEIDAIHYFEEKQPNRSNPIQGAGIAIFSAGNASHDFSHYPGAFVDIISVSAFGPDLLPTNYTCYGPGSNIAAPGGEYGQVETFKSCVLSTMPSELASEFDGKREEGRAYGYMQGTSMACPHVSGVVALGLSYAKKLGKTFDRDEFKKLILASTQDIDKRIASRESKTYVDVKFSMNGGTYKYPAHGELKLAPFYHKMGTGAIDAWSLMMHIEGISSAIVSTGDKPQWVDLSPWFGTSSVSLTYLGEEMPNDASAVKVEMSASDREAMGVSEEPYIKYGRLYIHPTKLGSGKVIIKAVGGGDHVGGGNNPSGGMEISQTISIISRPAAAENGGWL